MLSILVAASGLLASCDSGSEEPGAPISAQEAFAVVVAVRGGDESTAVVVVEDAREPGSLDLSDALTLPIGSVVGSPFERDSLFAISGESPRLTRWRVTADGFEEGPTLAFDALLTPTRLFSAPNFVFLRADKAYLFDPFAGEVIIWDPTEMTVTGRFALPRDQVPPGLFPVAGFDPIELGDGRLLFTLGFASAVTDTVSETSLILVINGETDEVERVVAVDVCGYLIHAWPRSDGDVLLGTGAFSTAVEATTVGARAGPSCVARLSSDLTVEPTPLARSGNLTGGEPSGSFVFVSDESAFMRVLDTERVPDPTAFTTRELNTGELWRWGFVEDLRAPSTFSLVDGSSFGAGFTRTLLVDGRRFAVESRVDFSGGRLIELRSDGTIVPGVDTPQQITNLIPLRL